MIERLDAFMARANAAYYATHDPFADFTTSPEISQAFGELLGLWAAVAWEMLGRPRPVLLAEAGPGRGTLMADALRAITRAAPEFRAALSLHLIETSPRLRAQQAARLPEANWHASLATLPDAPLLLLANEFLDALPIRQFVRRGEAWAERCVEERPATYRWHEATRHPRESGDSSDALVPSFAETTRDVPPMPPGGTILEVCEPARAFVADLSLRFGRHPGAALFLDYGPERSTPGDSLQAIANGQPADPLSPPGTADLTAHVDFAALAAIARGGGAAVHGPIPQGIFLARLGLFQRTDRLAQGQPPARAAALIDAAQRLAEPNRMGRLFKAMAIGRAGCGVLPGFAG
ncbi:MAG TPA: SAM-dependent methyltransferase [Acetobacteraceae bacterium]|jgi:SAM-dependent MidA family methyltransferase